MADAPGSVRNPRPCLAALLAALALAPVAWSQQGSANLSTVPLAFVPVDGKAAARVTGALEVFQGKAVIAATGSVTAGETTAEVTLPRRGILRVCASTTVKLAADASVPSGDLPGLMLALDRGALEMSLATTRTSDVVMTPDFRILVAGPGASEVKLRLGEHGDTCVDNGAPGDRSSLPGSNAGLNAPYVLVSSVFEGGAFRVQPGQRVMFQHGSLHEVVDNEKEPCGCPPPTDKNKNEFPLAESAGLAAAPVVLTPIKPEPQTVTTGPLVYNSPALEDKPPAPAADKPVEPAKPAAKKGFLAGLGRFFRRLFGAE